MMMMLKMIWSFCQDYKFLSGKRRKRHQALRKERKKVYALKKERKHNHNKKVRYYLMQILEEIWKIDRDCF